MENHEATIKFVVSKRSNCAKVVQDAEKVSFS